MRNPLVKMCQDPYLRRSARHGRRLQVTDRTPSRRISLFPAHCLLRTYRANCCPPRTTSHGRKNPTRPIAAGVDTSYIHCSQLGGFPTHPLTRGVMRALFFLFFFCFFLFVCLNNYAASLVPYTNAVFCWRCGVHKFDVDRGVRVCIWMGRMQSTTKQKQSLADVCDHNGSPKFLSFFFNSSSLHST